MKPEANDQSYFGVAFTAGTATDASSAVRRRRRRRGGAWIAVWRGRRGGAWIAVIVRPPRHGERFGHYGQSHSGIPRGLAKSVGGNRVLAERVPSVPEYAIHD
jgi:hypothetical protein